MAKWDSVRKGWMHWFKTTCEHCVEDRENKVVAIDEKKEG